MNFTEYAMDLKHFCVLSLLIVINCCGFSNRLHSQEQLDIEVWDINNGLANRKIHFVSRGPAGFLWVVTSDLQLFNGHEFTLFNSFSKEHHLPISDIRGALQFSDSTLILANSKQFYSFNMATWQSAPLPFPAGMELEESNLKLLIQKSHQPDVVLITRDKDHQTIHLVDKSWKQLLQFKLSKEQIFQNCFLANGPSGILWFADQENNQIQKITANEITEIPFDFGKFKGEYRSHLFYHPVYGLLVIQSDGLIHRYHAPSNSWDLLLAKQRKQPGKMVSVHLGADQKLWLTFKDAIIIIDLETASSNFQPINVQGNFNNRIIVKQIYEDTEQTSWYSTEIGLIKVSTSKTLFYSGSRGLDAQFREIFRYPGKATVLARIRQRKINMIRQIYPTEQLVDTTNIYFKAGRFLPYHQSLLHLLPGKDQLEIFDLSSLKKTKHKLPVIANSSFFNQSAVQGGELHYLDINKNITVYNLNNGRHRTICLQQKELFRSALERFIIINQDRYLVGWNHAGLTIHDAKTGALLHHFSTQTHSEVSSDFMNCLFIEGKDSLWLGTLGGGLLHINLKTEEVQTYTIKDGLSNNQVASIIEDDFGNLWIGTYFGLNRLDREQKQFYNYFVEDGLPNNEFNYLSAFKDDNGQLFFGTIDGHLRFHPKDLFTRRSLPKVALTGIQKYNRKLDQLTFEDRQLDQLKTVSLSPYDNYIEFSFAVPSFITPGKYQYLVKMEGMDQDWENLGGSNSIRYRKLPAGRYTLQVKAQDANGLESHSLRSIELQVQDFFYKSWWFSALIIALLSGSFFLFYQYRMNLLRKETETRIRIAQDLHDEIGSSMTRISLQLQLLEPLVKTTHKLALKKVGKVVDGAIVQLRDLVWAIDKSSDHWSEVLTRMEDYAYDTLIPREVLFSMENTAIDPKRIIHPRDKRNIYLIFKEAVHNIAKHSDATRVKVKLSNEDTGFTMTILDNGTSNGSIKPGNGLSNLQMRAERVGGKLSYEFKEGKGFRIQLTVPRTL